MTRGTAGGPFSDESMLTLTLELKRQERRRNLRYRTSVNLDPEEVKNKSVHKTITPPPRQKTVDEYAKELEQWLKKMKCTGVTGIRLESFKEIKVGINEEPVDPSSPSLEPYPNLWTEEKFTYKGYKDELGRAKGRATLEFENGDSINGFFQEGLRHGECRIETSRLNLTHVTGNYVKDQLHGRAKVHFQDGEWIEGFFCKGVLHGFVRKFDEKGRLKAIANYRNGLPFGVCWRVNRGGGCVVGRVNAKGCLTGMRVAYLYPDFKTAFIGSFEDGCLESAQAVSLKSVIDDRGIKVPIFTEAKGPSYKREISDFFHVTSEPLLPDPYESCHVFIKKSQVEGADDGLFARADVEPNTMLAFYNGLRLNPKVSHDMPEWHDNAYRIFDPTRKDGTIDIPKDFIPSSNYCASLAHKVNHSFMPNAEFVIFDHPRFGLVPGILSTLDIKEGEEIYVHYGYELDHCPDWYEALWQAGSYPVPGAFKEWSIVEEKKGIVIENM